MAPNARFPGMIRVEWEDGTRTYEAPGTVEAEDDGLTHRMKK